MTVQTMDRAVGVATAGVATAGAATAVAGTSTGAAQARTAAGRRALRRRAERSRIGPRRNGPVPARPGSGASAGAARRPVAVASGSGCPPVEQPYRMGRWARLSLTITTVAVVIAGAWSIGADRGVEIQEVVVQTGDTVEAIAERAQPGVDPAVMVDRIRELNDLDGMQPLPGYVLRVPVSG